MIVFVILFRVKILVVVLRLFVFRCFGIVFVQDQEAFARLIRVGQKTFAGKGQHFREGDARHGWDHIRDRGVGTEYFAQVLLHLLGDRPDFGLELVAIADAELEKFFGVGFGAEGEAGHHELFVGGLGEDVAVALVGDVELVAEIDRLLFEAFEVLVNLFEGLGHGAGRWDGTIGGFDLA